MPRSRAGTLQEAPIGGIADILTRARVRRLVQLAVFTLFAVVTVTGADATHSGWIPDNLFSRLDPLVALAAVVASRAWIGFWAAALLTLALTVAFGRAWCGWLCPVGTLLDLLPARGGKRPKRLPRALRIGKYALLALVLGAAVFGRLGPMVLDPVTILTRPLQEIARPYLGADSVGRAAGLTIARASMRSVALLSLLPLAGVLALNAVSRRTWCCTLCPLGALLALVSKLPGIRRVVDAEACTSCSRCARVCPTGAIEPAEGHASSSAECTVCMTCEAACPNGAISFRPAPASVFEPGFRPERRDAILALGASGLSIAAAVIPMPALGEGILRPPSTDDRRLAELCIRCGACYSACPTGALKPSLSATNPAGLWTPMLEQRPAHCSLNCNRCARVCPTDALHTLSDDERQMMGIGGYAVIDRPRCRGWGRGKHCLRCMGVCPISGAIIAVDRAEQLGGGQSVNVPVVVASECVACGLCIRACPVMPSAIGLAPAAPPLNF